MKIAEKVSHDRLREMAREEYRRQFPGPVRNEMPGTVNADAARHVGRPVVFAFRGEPYTLPPIPWEDGVALYELQMRFLRPGSTDEYRDACREAVRLMGRLAHRRGWRGRLRRILPNPFRHASEGEIGEVLDFFWTCRTGLRFPVWLDRMIAHAKRTGSAESTSSRARKGTDGDPRAGVITSTG